jgi:tetratricopeptide (TPR) repeat protein
MKSILLGILCLLFCGNAAFSQQLFTMSNACYELSKKGRDANRDGRYEDALNIFGQMKTKKCDSKDALVAIGTGNALAYNGLKQYNDGLKSSEAALKASKNSSAAAWFAKASALKGLNRDEESKQCIQKVIDITQKNKNVKDRATIFATLSDLMWQDNHDSAYSYIEQAITLDSANANFLVQKGDMNGNEGKFEEGLAAYDKAVSLGKKDQEMYTIRATARLKMLQEKYHTKSGSDLKNKMSNSEKGQVCTDLKKALQLGLKDIQLDMFSTMVCD